ncbi:MAG: metallophosphoesterase [Eubacterium sp.]|nr:metallophosphoesterase [Eubacterium sp.]
MKKEKLITTRYDITLNNLTSPLTDKPSLRLALVSDLHDRNPGRLLRLLKEEMPDLILVAGDTLERHEEGYEGHTMEEIDSYQETSGGWTVFCNFLKRFHQFLKRFGIAHDEKTTYGRTFLKKASRIAPLYMSMGNHEWYLLPQDRALIKKYRITVLDNEDCETVVKGIPLRIGGLSTMHDTDWLKKYAKKDGTKILLCHHPEYYLRFVLKNDLKFDLVLAGHAHGGQWRFFGRGILSPGQGFLPRLHHGIYGDMVVGAGVSNTFFIPRFGNPCELVILQVHGPWQ